MVLTLQTSPGMKARLERILLATERPLLIAGAREVLRYAALDAELSIIFPGALAHSVRPAETSLVILDGDGEVSWDAVKDVRSAAANSRFVVWSSCITPQLICAAVGAGMHGVLSTSLPLDEAAEALVQIAGGECQFRYGNHAASKTGTLSQREELMLSMVANGFKNREIAAAIGKTENNVKVSLNRLFRKTGTHSRSELTSLTRPSGPPPREPVWPAGQEPNDDFDTLWMFPEDRPAVRKPARMEDRNARTA